MFHLRPFFILFIFLIPNYLNAAEYVGVQQCKSCHQKEYALWQGSHHDMAMKHADKNSVLGNFNNITLKFSDKNSRFYKKDNQYWVNIQGPDGKLHDYQIKYTFGFEPLQQYMVEFDDGRVQLIPFAWDSRSKQQGGQRWFNLYPEYTNQYQAFYWTNTGQNWNYMCADCHSTNVQKNFNVKNNTYKTTWSEINVACEACHGPASEHLEWTKNKKGNNGFDRNLGKPVSEWIKVENKSTAQPKTITQTQQVLMCAQCHSRHTQLSNENHLASNSLGDRYLLSFINNDNYHPDGQIYDEVYVYGSFLQSKMHKKGVTCSNCHEPHSAKLTLPKETLCLQCHDSETYNTKTHHNHPENSTGAQCINCHMPETTYMQIDQRADHGWHIPRPDLSLKLGTPDTCLTCHDDKDSQWSDQSVKKWYPQSNIDKQSGFSTVFALADMNLPQTSTYVSQELTKISQDKNYAEIIRASALERMQDAPDQNSLISIARAVKDKNELIRVGAIRGARNMPQAERWQLLEPLLDDKVLAVRTEAAAELVTLWQNLSTQQQTRLQPALDDYLRVQDFNADRGFAHTNRGNTLAYMGRDDEAEAAYDQSIRIEPGFSTAYVNKADLYRRRGDESKTIATLKQGIKAQPDSGDMYYSLGLSMIRDKKKSAAIDYLKKAAELEPQNSNYSYVYALSLMDTQPVQAQKALNQTYQLSRNPQHLYALCELQIEQRAFQAKQCLSKLSKVVPAEVVAPLRQRLSELEQK